MKKLILFSVPTDNNIFELEGLLFFNELKEMKFAYLQSDGRVVNDKFGPNGSFTNRWLGIALMNDATFEYVDNSTDDPKEKQKILDSNILLITGGNVCDLLYLTRKNGFDKTILEFMKKDDFIIAGFSAGAMLLTPSVELGNMEPFNENNIGLTDFTGLNIVDFEVFPHYSDELKDVYEKYSKSRNTEVRKISDDEILVIDL